MRPVHLDDDITVGLLRIDPRRSSASLSGRALTLTAAQCLVLAVLARKPGKVLSRNDLYTAAFARPMPPSSRAIDQHVARLRSALGDRGGALVSVDRVGYRLDPSRLERA